MKITLIVECEVDNIEDGKITPKVAKEAATEAIDEALKYCMGRGFNHKRSDTVSINVETVKVLPYKWAAISWTPNDVQTIRPKWSLKKCEDWLYENEKYLASGCVESGWRVMEDLI